MLARVRRSCEVSSRELLQCFACVRDTSAQTRPSTHPSLSHRRRKDKKRKCKYLIQKSRQRQSLAGNKKPRDTKEEQSRAEEKLDVQCDSIFHVNHSPTLAPLS